MGHTGLLSKVCVAVLISLAVAMFAFGAAGEKGEKGEKKAKEQLPEVTVKGKVEVEKNPEGQVTGAKIVTLAEKPETYVVSMSKAGKELAETMAGKVVEVKGVVHTGKDGVNRIKVTSFSEVKAEK